MSGSGRDGSDGGSGDGGGRRRGVHVASHNLDKPPASQRRSRCARQSNAATARMTNERSMWQKAASQPCRMRAGRAAGASVLGRRQKPHSAWPPRSPAPVSWNRRAAEASQSPLEELGARSRRIRIASAGVHAVEFLQRSSWPNQLRRQGP